MRLRVAKKVNKRNGLDARGRINVRRLLHAHDRQAAWQARDFERREREARRRAAENR